RVGAHRDEVEDPVHRVAGQAEIRPDQHVAHVVGAALVELVDLAQHQRLQLAVGHALGFEEAAQQLAVVELDGEGADVELGEHRVDAGRQLGVVAHAEAVLADHVDVALVELAVAAALLALAAVDALHLIAAERERQLCLVLGHVTRQRHGQVEAQRQLRRGAAVAFLCVVGARASGLDEIHLTLGLAAGLGQQHLGQLHHRRFHRQEAEAFEIAADRVEHALERDLVTGQQLHDPGRGARLDQDRLRNHCKRRERAGPER
ncbi:hypothetical protein CATMIT_02012, partial [Catenibacterium mitsuokai DSM 15897]